MKKKLKILGFGLICSGYVAKLHFGVGYTWRAEIGRASPAHHFGTFGFLEHQGEYQGDQH